MGDDRDMTDRVFTVMAIFVSNKLIEQMPLPKQTYRLSAFKLHQKRARLPIKCAQIFDCEF